MGPTSPQLSFLLIPSPAHGSLSQGHWEGEEAGELCVASGFLVAFFIVIEISNRRTGVGVRGVDGELSMGHVKLGSL